MATEKNLSNLVINEVESQEVYDYMKANGLINADELYFIRGTEDEASPAGSEFGLVKSGGDVTIENGVITVNDDSHSHVIDNVDGLQDALRGKVDIVSGKGLSSNDYTSAEKSKLASIAENAEVNQNAFSNIAVGDVTVSADSETDTLTLTAGANVSITPDAANDKITISATDTVYTHPSYTTKSSGLYKITIDATGHVSGTDPVSKSDITGLGIPAQDTTYGTGTASAPGLTKLYTGTGSNTDGTMTQKAIADELSKFASGSVNVTLAAASWSENKQTVTVSGLGATQNGIIGPANNLTADQQSAMGNAQLYVVSQASDEVTIGCHGDTPTIDVPITVILFP